MRPLLALVVLLMPSVATAETPVVVATNAPIIWPHSVAGSVYVPLSAHHVLRANVASYVPILQAVTTLSNEDDHHTYAARTTDAGVGLVHYADKRYAGYMVEVGMLVRRQRASVVEYDDPDVGKQRMTTAIAGRAMIGWSWLFWRRAFAAVAVGGSVGYQWGYARTLPDHMELEKVPPLASALEGYLRFGVLLDF